MQLSLKKYLKGDKAIWMMIIMLMMISLIVVFTSTSNIAYIAERRSGAFYKPFLWHVAYVFLAFITCMIGANIKPRYFRRFTMVLLLLSLFLLIFVLLFGPTINGGKRIITLWFFTFQPSEIARLALINYTAYELGRSETYNEKSTLIRILVVTLVFGVLIGSQNLSTALFLIMVVFLMCLFGGANKRLMWIVSLSGVVAGVLFLLFLKLAPASLMESLGGRFSTWSSRLNSQSERMSETKEEITDLRTLRDEDFQQTYSKIAMARGGLTGVGPGKSETRHILPQPYSDFIYSMIVEEYGLVGGGVVLLLYLTLFFRAGAIARRARNMYLKLLIMGIGVAIFIQAMIHILVCTGYIPVTGQPLPFISRGGTSYLITSVYFAVLLSAANADQEETAREIAMAGGNDDHLIDPLAVPVVASDDGAFDDYEDDLLA